MSRTSSDPNAALSPPSASRWARLASRLVGHLRSRPHLLWLAAIFVLALALRLAWIAYAGPDPNDGRFDDTLFYDHAAQTLAAGEGYTGFADQQTANWPPGYPLLLAAIYKVFGHSVLAAKLLNAFAGAATCLLVYAIAAVVFNRRAGLLAALILALFPGQIYYTTLVMTESVSAAVLALLLLLVLTWTLKQANPSPLRLFLLGLLFGATALLRAEAGILLLVVLLVWKLAIPSWREFARQGALLLIGAALAVMPWTVRNAIAMDAFIPIASGVGHTFLAGHQQDPYDPYSVFPETHLRLKYSYLPFPEREVKVERESLREGLEFMVSHPAYEVQLLFEKLYNLYRDDSDALKWIRGAWVHASEVEWLKDSWVESLDRVGEPVVAIPPSAEDNWSRLADGYYYAVMLCALIAAPLWLSFRDRKRLLVILFVAGWTLAHLMFVPGPRYHAPLIPIFCLWAALILAAAWERAVAYTKREGTEP